MLYCMGNCDEAVQGMGEGEVPTSAVEMIWLQTLTQIWQSQ